MGTFCRLFLGSRICEVCAACLETPNRNNSIFRRLFLAFVFRESLIHQAGGDITKPTELRESSVRSLIAVCCLLKKSQMLRTRNATELAFDQQMLAQGPHVALVRLPRLEASRVRKVRLISGTQVYLTKKGSWAERSEDLGGLRALGFPTIHINPKP